MTALRSPRPWVAPVAFAATFLVSAVVLSWLGERSFTVVAPTADAGPGYAAADKLVRLAWADFREGGAEECLMLLDQAHDLSDRRAQEPDARTLRGLAVAALTPEGGLDDGSAQP